MKLQIRVDEAGNISDVKFKTFGCGSAIASSSYMTERVKGMTLEQAGQVRNTEIAKELCLPPVKREFGVLPLVQGMDVHLRCRGSAGEKDYRPGRTQHRGCDIRQRG